MKPFWMWVIPMAVFCGYSGSLHALITMKGEASWFLVLASMACGLACLVLMFHALDTMLS